MLNTILEHVPIKLESFDDDDELSDCSTWKASTTSTESDQATISRRTTTTSRTSTTSSRSVQLDNEIESCGNVFTLSRRKLYLSCGYCDCKYTNMLKFSQHLNDHHRTFETNEDTNSSHGLTSEGEGESDVPLITGLFQGGFKIHFLRNGALADISTIPTPPPSLDDAVLKHVPIKVEENLDDDITMVDDNSASALNFVNNVESCGNIFVMNRRKLILVCGFCEGKYANMELFSLHLQERHDHFQGSDADGLVPPNNCLPVTIKEEPQEIPLAIKRRDTSNEISLPMVAIPNGTRVSFDDLIPRKELIKLPQIPTKILQGEEEKNQEMKNQQQPLQSSSPARTELLPRERIGTNVDLYELIPSEERSRSPKIQKQTLAGDENEHGEMKDSKQQSTKSCLPPKTADLSKEISSPNIWPCEFCKKTFRKQFRLLEHLRVHTGEKPFKCEECGKAFRIKLRMTEHQLRHRSEKAFICEVCGLGCSTRQDYTLHQRHHTGDKRYPCVECGKRFVRSCDLKTHMHVHSGERPYECETCGLKFGANQNLIMHRRVHQTEKQFQCDYCTKRFHRKIDKRVHHRTHTGEKAYKCEICDKGYSSKVHVRRHIQQQHMNPLNGVTKKIPPTKNFRCDTCFKSYSSIITLQRHVKQAHNVEQPPARTDPVVRDGTE